MSHHAAITLPARARVVVIGGGIIGTSIAYHLGHLGWTDTVLVERDQLTSGTTWHAAGLMVTFGSTSETSTQLRTYTRDLYTRLEAETGLATGFKPVGFVELAADEDRLEEYRRVSTFNRHCGVDVHELSPREVAELFPLARTDDLLAGFYVPGDGRVNPVDATMSLAKGARQTGVTIAQGVTVIEVIVTGGRVRGVVTDHGTIECEHVVNAAGMWARQLGEKNGVSIPLQAAEHYYLITEQMEGLDPACPVIEDPANFGYYREEVGGLMIGLFETKCAPWNVKAIPHDSSFTSIQPDWDRMGPYVEAAMSRVPRSLDTGIRTFFCGPESFTPDLRPIVGPVPEVHNYWVAAGLNSIGILTGGGLGRMVAHWIADGDPGADVTGMHPARLQRYQANPEYRRTRTVESLGMVYQCHYPNKALHTARNAKLSPLHSRLVQHGAYFRDVSGWESADWFAGEGNVADNGSLTWTRPTWWANWEAEHRACREAVVVMDMSFMSKFRVQGRDAGRLLDTLSANAVNGDAGQITYTQWLNERGQLEADLTVTKVADDEFLVVATDTAHRRVESLLHRHFAADGGHAFATDVTGAYAQINVQGPNSRALLQTRTTADLSNEAFPFRTAREIDLGFARVLCVRITYLGELGYELYVPTEQAVHVYDLVSDAGAPFGLRRAGLKALASLRMEKGYRDYGHDIDNTDDPLSAGFGFALALDKPGGFVGRAAVLARKAVGPLTQRLVQLFVHDPEPLMFHAEVVRRNGVAAGYVRAASYGHTLGGAVGLAMVANGGAAVTPAWLAEGEWTVEIAGRTYSASASLRPLYDPDNTRIKS
ncbi:MAG: FAD-dependent oxidoreductase [Actinomycetota bacterium]|nr:FAD-dependent oxidoreductase [Actinomycetota bacterium]